MVKKQAFLKCLIAMLAISSIVESKSLSDYYNSVREGKTSGATPRVKQDKIAAADTEGEYGGMDPVAGRSLLSVFLTDIVNVVTAPGAVSYAALLFDVFNFIFMPIVGGLMMASVTYNYDLDAVTYRNASLTKADMYASEMKLIKTSAYKALGKPNFFGEQAAYQPPNIAGFADI